MLVLMHLIYAKDANLAIARKPCGVGRAPGNRRTPSRQRGNGNTAHSLARFKNAGLRRNVNQTSGLNRGHRRHHGTTVPSHEMNEPVDPSSGSVASRTASTAASAGSPAFIAASCSGIVARTAGVRLVARRPGARAFTLMRSAASVCEYRTVSALTAAFDER